MSKKSSNLIHKFREFLIIVMMFLFILLAVKFVTDYNYIVSNFRRLFFNAIIVSGLASFAMLFLYRKNRH